MMIHIEDKRRFRTADQLLDYQSHDIPFRIWPVAEYGDNQYFPQMKAAADAINLLDEEEWEMLEADLFAYREKLKKYRITDFTLTNPSVSYGFLVAGAPLALAGGLFLYPVRKIVYGIQKRLNREAEYISGFRMAGFLLFIPLFILLWMGIGAMWLGVLVFLFVVVLPVLSMISVLWLDQWRRWRHRQRWKKLTEPERENLLRLRRKVMRVLEWTESVAEN